MTLAEIEKPSPQQLRILQGIADGVPRPTIAQQIHISLNTVKRHLGYASLRLEGNNASHAVAICLRLGWIK